MRHGTPHCTAAHALLPGVNHSPRSARQGKTKPNNMRSPK